MVENQALVHAAAPWLWPLKRISRGSNVSQEGEGHRGLGNELS